jgi:hypothetical protein
MGTEQNFTGNPFVKDGAADPWNREPLWRSDYTRSNWIYNYLTKLNQIRSFLKQNYGELFFVSHQETIHVDQNTYVYKKGPIIVIVSNQSFNQSKYFYLPSNSNIKRWKNLLSNKIIRINRFNLFKIDNSLPILLLPLSSSKISEDKWSDIFHKKPIGSDLPSLTWITLSSSPYFFSIIFIFLCFQILMFIYH